jgi:hypothetical protein
MFTVDGAIAPSFEAEEPIQEQGKCGEHQQGAGCWGELDCLLDSKLQASMSTSF